MQVVGGDQRQLQILGDPEQIGSYPVFDGQAVVHQLNEVVGGAEQIAELRRTGDRILITTEPKVGLHLTGGATRGSDQPAGVPASRSRSIRGL
jgi:hypothetical protein